MPRAASMVFASLRRGPLPRLLASVLSVLLVWPAFPSLAGASPLIVQYDAEGRRSKKIGEDGIRQYVYDGTSVLTEYDDQPQPEAVARYTYGPMGLLGFTHRTEGQRFTVTDALGSVTGLTSATGDPVTSYRFDPWGNLRNPEALTASANRYGFTGYRFDPETQLYHAQARQYDPKVGRFLTQDPFPGWEEIPATQHPYVYALNAPTVYTDPTGEAVPIVVAWLLKMMLAGAVAGGTYTATRQTVEILEGTRGSYDVGDILKGAGTGAVILPAAKFAPWLVVPYLTIQGVQSARHEFAQGHYATGAFDLATSLLPFGSKRVRGEVFRPGPLLEGLGRGLRAETIVESPISGRLRTERIGGMPEQLGLPFEPAAEPMPFARMLPAEGISGGSPAALEAAGQMRLFPRGRPRLAGPSAGFERYVEAERQALAPNRGAVIESFPGWKVGDPITKLTPTGEYPAWYLRAAADKATSIQGRYWMNRAAAAAPGEFTPRQLRSMRAGFAPETKALVRVQKTGALEVRSVTKELHHARRGRGMPGFDEPIDLREVWPWEHSRIDPQRRTGYTFLGFPE